MNPVCLRLVRAFLTDARLGLLLDEARSCVCKLSFCSSSRESSVPSRDSSRIPCPSASSAPDSARILRGCRSRTLGHRVLRLEADRVMSDLPAAVQRVRDAIEQVRGQSSG
jgi:hypothetical protein